MGERLSSIQTIPDAGLHAVQWAFDTIVEARMTQKAIRAGLNERLEKAGVAGASASSFNRYVAMVRDGKVRRPEIVSAAPKRMDLPVDAMNDDELQRRALAIVAGHLNGLSIVAAENILSVVSLLIRQTSKVGIGTRVSSETSDGSCLACSPAYPASVS